MNNNKSRFSDNFSFDAGEIVKSTLVGLKTNYQWQIGEVHHLSVAGAYRFTSFNTEGEVDNMSEPHGSHTASLQLQDSWYYTNRLQLHLAARIEWLDISMKTGVPLQFGAIYRLSDRHRATFLFLQGNRNLISMFIIVVKRFHWRMVGEFVITPIITLLIIKLIYGNLDWQELFGIM